MSVNIIAALTEDRVIGIDNALPWRIPEDLKNFKRLTSGNTVVMGRKTFESIGKPLPDRNNIVISRSLNSVEGAVVCSSFEEALEKAKSFNVDVFIIGGASIYELALPLADKMFLSFVKGQYEGDTFFPVFDESDWIVDSREDYGEFELVVYSRA